ncbi:MAG: PQQ-dependent sugar dehydrogenase [Methylococcales bacterium]
MKSLKRFIFLLLLFNSAWLPAKPASNQEVIQQLKLPPGFKISIFAEQLPNARSLALAEQGVVFIGTGSSGEVYAVQDIDGDGVADKRYSIATGLFMPNGVAYKDGVLYVAEVNRIIRFERILQHLDQPPKPSVVYDQLPSEKHHGWKYLRFGADGKLYTAIGSPCNVCKPENPVHGSIVRLKPDGSEFEIIAKGIRSVVGFDWQPGSEAMFFTDNGRDYLGDDAPADELNQWTAVGEQFGFPYCHGGDVPDPEFAAQGKCQQFVAPVWQFKAHVAPLGMRFYQGKQFPAEYKDQLFVAQHGSWNRSVPQGYQVALVKFTAGKPVSEQSFVQGWLTADGSVLGRPVDIAETPDGSLLVSDDQLGVIYRITYQGK